MSFEKLIVIVHSKMIFVVPFNKNVPVHFCHHIFIHKLYLFAVVVSDSLETENVLVGYRKK